MSGAVAFREPVKPPTARLAQYGPVGSFTIVVRAEGLAPVELTTFRGLPTSIGQLDWEDPFGPNTLQLTFPGVTVFDRRGSGDLAWAVKDADLDLVYDGPLPEGYPGGGWRWEGFLGSFNVTANGLNVSCVGAMHQIDLTLAKPEYVTRPLPYEVAISRQFVGRADLRTKPLKVEWPAWWKTRYTDPVKGTPSYLVPSGVKTGDNWTGLVTRETGRWDARLTGYVQGLLSSMYTERGRWTLDLDPGRQPVLRHRDMRLSPSDADVVIDAAAPGVDVDLTEDWTQSANVAYGQGSSLAGVGYTGMEVSADGLSTTYQPLAALRQVEPTTDKNGWFQRSRFRREVNLQLQQGLSGTEAQQVARAHLARFGSPGHTGTITLKSDPSIGGVSFPHMLMKAGMSVRLPHVYGDPDGLLLHVSRADYDPEQDTTTLTVDSLYRDQLTVAEVQKRTRDALQVTRMLVAGQYQPPVPDQLLPWDYAGGSGFIPSGPQLSSQRLFAGMPNATLFPWSDWTTQRPPKSASWSSCYIHLGPASQDANKNWASVSDKTGTLLGVPIKMAQAGSIRLLQLAAYDRDGHVLPVGFHCSLYYSRGVNYQSTPMMPTDYEARYPPYKGGQHFPLFPAAWETYNDDGTQQNPATANAVETAGLVRAWGSNFELAGYWPGSSAAGDTATGLLVDESVWQFDCTHFDSTFDPYSPTANKSNPFAGQLYLMIWCDQQKNQDVYFAGRMFRVEPGSGV